MQTYILDIDSLILSHPGSAQTLQRFGAKRARVEMMEQLQSVAQGTDAVLMCVLTGGSWNARQSASFQIIWCESPEFNATCEGLCRAHPGAVVVTGEDDVEEAEETYRNGVIGGEAFLRRIDELRRGTRPKSSSEGRIGRPHRVAELLEKSEKPSELSRTEIEEMRRHFNL